MRLNFKLLLLVCIALSFATLVDAKKKKESKSGSRKYFNNFKLDLSVCKSKIYYAFH